MLHLLNLDARVRQLMLAELASDVAAGRLYTSPRLNASGCQDYPKLLEQAIRDHDDAWLSRQLWQGRMNDTEYKTTPKRGTFIVRVPWTAAETLAEGEFNRFYIRGVCRVAEEDRIPEVEIYRAKDVENPREKSLRLVGTRTRPHALLDDLRTHSHEDPVHGVPGGPNSGLSVRLPQSGNAIGQETGSGS
jgi:hypothetical protein